VFKLLKSYAISGQTKQTIYRAVIKSVEKCSSEVCTLSRSDENTLTVWERKILREIFGPVKENGLWMIRSYQELLDLCREPDIISEIRKGRLQWLGRVERVPLAARFFLLNELGRECSRISQKDKCPLESQDRGGWAILKII
jgi:hypothetical protein